MGCDRFDTPDGAIIICSRGRKVKCKEPGCDRTSVALCDWPLGGPRFGKTCSRHMCAAHRKTQEKLPNGETRDFCPTHDRYAKQPHIFCPRCHMPSANPNDIEKRYCGFCHSFHDDLHLLPPYKGR